MKLGTMIHHGRSCLGGTATVNQVACAVLIYKRPDKTPPTYSLRVELGFADPGLGLYAPGINLQRSAATIDEAIKIVTDFIERKTGERLAIVAPVEA